MGSSHARVDWMLPVVDTKEYSGFKQKNLLPMAIYHMVQCIPEPVRVFKAWSGQRNHPWHTLPGQQNHSWHTLAKKYKDVYSML